MTGCLETLALLRGHHQRAPASTVSHTSTRCFLPVGCPSTAAAPGFLGPAFLQAPPRPQQTTPPTALTSPAHRVGTALLATPRSEATPLQRGCLSQRACWPRAQREVAISAQCY